MKTAAVFATLAILPLIPSAVAQEVGQYAIAMFPPESNTYRTTYHHALIIDTKNGYVWEWISQPSIAGSQAFQALMFQGQAVPGKNSGPPGPASAPNSGPSRPSRPSPY